jgi:ATP-dependent DNA helicase RecG
MMEVIARQKSREEFKESESVELKRSTAELKQALEDLCAFANTGMGTVYFGITDQGEAVGQQISDDTFKRVSSTILSSLEPRLYPNIYREQIKGRDVLVVEVKNSPEKPYFYKGKAYKRMGTTNAYLSRYEVEKYLYERENPKETMGSDPES